MNGARLAAIFTIFALCASTTAAASRVYFYFYPTLNAKGIKIPINDVDALMNAGFKPALPTRFVIHGFVSNINSEVNTVLRAALLSEGLYNVFSVDWSFNAALPTASFRVDDVGQEVAKFIDFLNRDAAMDLAQLHLIGHSLGAHVAGFAGKHVESGKIGIIYGLDAAGSTFNNVACEKRLCDTDAAYVESVHTNAATLGSGYIKPLGHTSFYANGGQKQPGCSILDIDICHHTRAYFYFAEAIVKNSFISTKCLDSTAAPSSTNTCLTSSTLRMGDPSNAGSSGVYDFETNSKSPFGQGN